MGQSNPSSADVAIIMGSDSDWPVMKKSFDALKQMAIESEVRILSAHRLPNEMKTYAESAQDRGIKVIIAGAGGAAHLPGMLAANTCLPVIGVPVSFQPMNGLDSLLSIVQMPKGVPVATVAIDNGWNAGLLAAQILGLQSKEIAARLQSYRRELAHQVQTKEQDLLKSLN